LGFRVGRAGNELVLLPNLVELHFELDYLRDQLCTIRSCLCNYTEPNLPSHTCSEDPSPSFSC
jgi:hypothetical protein